MNVSSCSGRCMVSQRKEADISHETHQGRRATRDAIFLATTRLSCCDRGTSRTPWHVAVSGLRTVWRETTPTRRPRQAMRLVSFFSILLSSVTSTVSSIDAFEAVLQLLSSKSKYTKYSVPKKIFATFFEWKPIVICSEYRCALQKTDHYIQVANAC